MTADLTRPLFPIFIPSKGRAKLRITMKALDKISVPYRVIVEEDERDAYAAGVDPSRLVVLDPDYKRRYETCDPAGDAEDRPRGSGPARNFIWDLAASEGASHHWVMDDNIRCFYRLDENVYGVVGDGTVIRCMEDFVLRYENVAMAGPNYFMFAPRKQAMPPFRLNTRIYSCNLIRTGVNYRWRGRYNEDTDLSLRMLKDGWCTILFNAFLQHKEPSQKYGGGNTDTIYVGGTLRKSQMLAAMHPDVAEVVRRWDRDHHHVDYAPFERNRLIRKSGLGAPPARADERGMVLVPAVARGNLPYTRKKTGEPVPFRPGPTRKPARAPRSPDRSTSVRARKDEGNRPSSLNPHASRHDAK